MLGGGVVQVNGALFNEVARIWGRAATPFSFPAWYAALVRAHVAAYGPRNWGRLPKADQEARILESLRQIDPIAEGLK